MIDFVPGFDFGHVERSMSNGRWRHGLHSAKKSSLSFFLGINESWINSPVFTQKWLHQNQANV